MSLPSDTNVVTLVSGLDEAAMFVVFAARMHRTNRQGPAGHRQCLCHVFHAAGMCGSHALFIELQDVLSSDDHRGFTPAVRGTRVINRQEALLLGALVDRFHFRWPLSLAYFALIVTLILLGASSSHAVVIALSGAVGFFLLGANYALYGVAPVYYPREIRGTGSGASIAVGRLGAIAGPLLAGFLMGGGTSATGVVRYMVPVAAISLIAVFALSFRSKKDAPPKRGAILGPT